MPENYINVLSLLIANPNGLTTNDILKACEKAKYLNINDIKQVSNLIFNMRAKGLLSSSNSTGGKIHHITPKGKEELRKEIGDIVDAKPVEKTEAQQVEVATLQPSKNQEHTGTSTTDPEQSDIEAEEQSKIACTANLLRSFDDAMHIIRGSILETLLLTDSQPKITDKVRKLATLESLAAMPIFTQDLVDMLNAIRSDLEQFEEA